MFFKQFSKLPSVFPWPRLTLPFQRDQDSGLARSELFLASKVWTDKIYEGRKAVREQVLQTLTDLQTDYLDVYLVHWPGELSP